MVDTKAITKTVITELKRRFLGKSQYGNKEWHKADDKWYKEIHASNYLLHENFMQYLRKKNDIQSILEIGCGTGVYPIQHSELFKKITYTGLDISQEAIDYCKKNSNFNFICGDFLKMEMPEKYDLVYSHAVIDHVYDIDKFISDIVQTCKKYAYINSYRGYFPQLKKHEMRWKDDDGCYYNDISVIQASEALINTGLKEGEFLIRPQDNGKGIIQTVIEITKKY